MKEGYISLQSESHPVEFRNVKLFNLAKYMKDPAKLDKMLSSVLQKWYLLENPKTGSFK
ncbi:MAG: DUF1080 domain-containing protein [Pedobacter sp.]|nr:DUF1080 domain-containing protein [Pedobacter sp.]